ncbi:MAG: hypothetical protein LBR79_04905 [Oscillospiraceae bacterium]|nr:hypothetical protein [Oscillospiraceae bacterium]
MIIISPPPPMAGGKKGFQLILTYKPKSTTAYKAAAPVRFWVVVRIN